MYDTIRKYFPSLTEKQHLQLDTIMRLYPEWNEKINVISRKDIDNLEINHVLHSMAIAKFITFTPRTQVLDLGTGGGFPAIPLAILFPDVNFLLVDRIAKKLRVANDVAIHAGIDNIAIFHGDIKEVKSTFDFVVSRAVMPLPDIEPLIRRLINRKRQLNSMPNGIICLKGGDLTAELAPFKKRVLVDNISSYFSEPFFDTKHIVYLASI